jgi:hypothetical protein
MMWKDRNNFTNFKQENPQDKPVSNPRDSWNGKSASFRMGKPHSPLSRGRSRCFMFENFFLFEIRKNGIALAD